MTSLKETKDIVNYKIVYNNIMIKEFINVQISEKCTIFMIFIYIRILSYIIIVDFENFLRRGSCNSNIIRYQSCIDRRIIWPISIRRFRVNRYFIFYTSII